MSDYVDGMVGYGVKLIHQYLVLHPQVSIMSIEYHPQVTIMSIALPPAGLYDVHSITISILIFVGKDL